MKILLEEFNDCPGTEEVQSYMQEHAIDVFFEVADADRTYYKNDGATLVLKQKDSVELTFNNGIALGQMAQILHADELHVINEGNDTFVRLWWD
jgi:hypothetical protein